MMVYDRFLLHPMCLLHPMQRWNYLTFSVKSIVKFTELFETNEMKYLTGLTF